jgi:hypothetical protein
VLQSVPLPIRVIVRTWQLAQPYRSLIRFTALVALMAVAGMSMTVTIGDDLRKVGAPPSSATTAADHSAADTVLPPADLNRPMEATTAPDADSTSIAPTAAGPASASSRARIAIAPAQPPSRPAYPTTSYPEPQLQRITNDSLPQVRTSEPAVARLRGQVIETAPR